MTLEAKLKVIHKKLESDDNFRRSEASVSQGIVLPILRELNWDTDDTRVVRPEHSVVKGRADFVLCDGSGNPKVIIEVKKLGAAKDGEKQGFRYAHSTHAPIVVLTDGGTWSFCLLEQGGELGYEVKRVYEIDILKGEDSLQESSEVLQRYLERSRVVLGEALETARVIFFLKKHLKNKQDVWEGPVNNAVTFLRELRFLAIPHGEKIKPKSAQANIVDYFHSLLREKFSQSSSGTTAQQTQSESEKQASSTPTPIDNGSKGKKGKDERNQSSRSGELFILGKTFHYKDAKDAMVIVFRELENRKPGFCQRFYNDPRNHGKTRRTIAHDPRELYDLKHLAKNHERIDDNWVIGTNNSNLQKEKIIEIAADVAELEFGKNIIVNFDA